MRIERAGDHDGATDHPGGDRRRSTSWSRAAGPRCAPSRGRRRSEVDRLCQAVAWAVANEVTFTRLAQMGVEESGIGDPESRVGKRFKVMGILRDVLRQKSVGVIEELPERGIVKYAKPVGLIASLVPTTNPELTPPGVGLFAIKCRDAVIFSPASAQPADDAARRSRSCAARSPARARRPTCCSASRRPSIPAAQYLMTQADLVQATGGRDMVKAAYSSGTPAYGVGAGNSTMVIDETADVAEAARNTRLSKTSDFGSGCSADGNLVVEASVYDALRDEAGRGGRPSDEPRGDRALRAALWDDEGHRTRGHDRDLRPGAGGARGLRRSRPIAGSSSSSRRRSASTTSSARRSSAWSWRCSATRGSTTRWTWSGPSTRSAARAIRAASTRSTTITSTGWRGSRR